MSLTYGQMLFYGGIAGAVLFAVLFFVLWGIFENKRRKMMKKIDDEYQGK